MSSKAEPPASTETKAVIIPRIPQDIIDEILDHLAADSDIRSLKTSVLVSKPWVQSCRRHLFHTVLFTSTDVDRWLETFPVSGESPARYVRHLRIWIGGDSGVPERFFEHTSQFTGAERVSLLGHSGLPCPLRPSFWRLPQSVTSLTIETSVVTLVQVRDIMAQLPNLDELLLSGPLATADRRGLPGIGTVLKGKFGGKLSLIDGHADEGVINMLLEIPSGLCFTEVRIHCTHERLLPAVRLAEACSKSLMKLLYTVTLHCKPTPSPAQQISTLTQFPDVVGCEVERSFDFSEFPNLQEVSFACRVGWRDGGLPWIPMAFSTLKSTTSPRLSSIQLDLAGSPLCRPANTYIRDMGDDLRRIADEFARIECEFGGAVNLTVVRDSKIKVVLDTLNVRFRFVASTGPRGRAY